MNYLNDGVGRWSPTGETEFLRLANAAKQAESVHLMDRPLDRWIADAVYNRIRESAAAASPWVPDTLGLDRRAYLASRNL